MKLIQIIDRPIAFQRSFVYMTKSINAALMLSQAVYWSNRTTLSDGWFYKVRDEWENETGLTRTEQETARKILRNLGILEENLRGVPAKMHYRINEDNLRTCLLETSRTVGGKPADSDVGNLPTYIGTETTTETTAESTTKALSTKAVSKFRLPDWIDSERWNDYEDMRKKLKKPMTDKARSLAVGKLVELEVQGSPHEAVLEQSIMNSWQGLFPVRDEGGARGTSKAQQRTTGMVNAGREVIAGISQMDRNGAYANRSDGGTGGEQGAPTLDGRVHTRQRSRALTDGESIPESSD